MQKVIHILDLISAKIGQAASWFAALMAVVIALDVVIRYVFRFTYMWMVEVEIYLFGILFLLASGYTFQHDKHVRVDVFYNKWSPKRKAWTDLLGGLFLLIPWCYVVIVSSWYYAVSSFLIGEGSPQPGGLPGIYVLKFCITLGFSLLLLQGVSQILKSLHIIIKKD
ncbi:TRAP transporter small permease subunit [Aquimarina brevivitae]|uniref:TRAP-type mannitol/chloroaromatic compound transport system permease small subunit n=1 Tax=Aquimarina brevivitae TaxID=323412 RepID=A0A4Q7PHR5_9FLAO|nr:TRAP transporter small permease subunit [Aquimarina brevivitae]RZT00132.1 TRAP-type mannitol/chloroaromatic compound transport system permease small subunit [Aquimarina brevivitae]